MPWTTPTLEQIHAGILRDIQNQRPDADVSADSDHWVRAKATASAILGLYQHQEWLARQILEDTCDTDWLERRAARYGLTYKDAVAASGVIQFAGQPGAAIPVGTEGRRPGGVSYVTVEAATVPAGGTVAVLAQAAEAGAAGNADADTLLTLVSAPAGVQNQATIVQMTGGADRETADELLARLLFRMQNPPHGGADHDYIAIAEAVPGVRFGATVVLHERRHYRSVDVVFRAIGGLPSVQLIDAVQAALDAKRAVTADVWAIGPAPVAVDVSVVDLVIEGRTLAEVTEDVRAVLEEYFDALEPGDSAVRSRISGLISSVTGVVDFTLASPAANVSAPVDAEGVRIAVLGELSLTLAA